MHNHLTVPELIPALFRAGLMAVGLCTLIVMLVS
jgi:hypothetical protein